MTPLSHILTNRSKTFSLSETIAHVEHRTPQQGTTQLHAPAQELPGIELAQIRQALLDMRAQIDMMVSAISVPEEAISQPTVTPHHIQQARPPIPYQTEQLPPPTYRHTQVYEASVDPTSSAPYTPYTPPQSSTASAQLSPRVIEGFFDGEQMVGSDGFHYPVPQNYASKSKMVEGDLLKLTITAGGKQYYKQIGPVERHSLVGELMQDPHGQWVALVGQTPYKVLLATITFHKARPGDKVSILVPREGHATWGAIDMFLR